MGDEKVLFGEPQRNENEIRVGLLDFMDDGSFIIKIAVMHSGND